ncbi:MAG: ankyrin repeat domain-containing protein [Alphaproteobacteria bacterium]|nr:MAG: ankyrin repeat domain-containing protein [Alphaproteobacteria bacterium]
MAVSKTEAETMGHQLLHELVQQRPDMEDICWLIGQGASMTVTDKSGYTPLMHMLGTGNSGYIKAMLDHGADVNYRHPSSGRSILQIAVSRSSAHIIGMVLAANGDVFQKDKDSDNALALARRRGDAGILSLVEARAKEQQPDYQAREALMAAAEAGMQIEKSFRPLKPLKFRMT